LLKQSNFSNQVVPVIAVGESGEQGSNERALWLFRQWVEGESLNLYFKREGRLRLSTAIAIAAQIVMGLDMIHRAGLLHRDIKPGHVMLQPHSSGFPRVVLLDTGVPARVETQSLFDLVGTPAYVSPEQIAGKLNSFRSDLYALGCVFYEMLVGRPPFASRDIDKLFKAHQSEPPPAPDIELPEPIQSLLLSLLAKEPRERPFSAQQVYRALEPFLVPSALVKSAAISTHAQAPQVVVTSQPLKTASGIASPISVPPPVPLGTKRGNLSSSPPSFNPRGSVSPPPPPARVKSKAPPPPPARIAGGVSSQPPRPTGSIPPLPTRRIAGGVSSQPPRPTGSVPPPVPARVKSKVPPPLSARIASGVSSQPPRTKSSVPPPPIPRGPIAIPKADPDGIAEFTRPGALPSDALEEQTDATKSKEFELFLDTGEFAAIEADDSQPPLSQGVEGVPSDRSTTESLPQAQEPGSWEKRDEFDQSGAVSSASIESRALEKLLWESAEERVKKPSTKPITAPESSVVTDQASNKSAADSPVKPSAPVGQGPVFQDESAAFVAEHQYPGERIPTVQPLRANHPSVDFSVESLFEDELSGADSQSRKEFESPLEPTRDSSGFSRDLGVQPVADPEGTTPIPMRSRLDRRLVIGIVGVLAAFAVLFVVLGSRPKDGEKREEVRSTPVAVSGGEIEKKADETEISAAKEVEKESEPGEAVRGSQVAESVEPATEEKDSESRLARDERGKEYQEGIDEDESESQSASSERSRKRKSDQASDETEASSTDKIRAEAREHYAAGRYKSAASAYNRVTKKTPSDAGAFAGLGASYLAMNKPNRAVTAYKRAIKLQPQNSGFHAALARAYATKGDRDRAIAAYQKALQLNPGNKVASLALKQLTQ
ncbi:MAG: tetratricopeptide repeat protein, partial [Deltaproteobacteria bacterium]|nr:tetratricopeptide repeat protein [Deltaproteobacteria bacterium]